MVDDDYENEIKDLTISESKKKKDDEDWEWASTVPEGVPPCARGGHSATLIGNIIVIFGGHYYSDKKIGFKYLNDTHYLNVKDSKWLKPYCTGKIPPPRYGHSSVYAGGYVIIFGGHGPKNMIYNDLYTYDPSKFVWLVANETGEAPQPRFNHTANVYNKKMYIFGGWNGTEYFNDVITFDLEKMVWSKLETSGKSPCPRQGHSSCIVGHNLIIQGGFFFEEDRYKKELNVYGSFLKSCYLNDLKVLDLKINSWTKLPIGGKPPLPRFGHTTSYVNKHLIIFGGWSSDSGRPYNMSSSQVSTKTETDHCYSLNLEQLEWESTKYKGPLPNSRLTYYLDRYGHTATVIQNNIIFFGGWEFGKALNDINILLWK